jgi:hypothetical protein
MAAKIPLSIKIAAAAQARQQGLNRHQYRMLCQQLARETIQSQTHELDAAESPGGKPASSALAAEHNFQRMGIGESYQGASQLRPGDLVYSDYGSKQFGHAMVVGPDGQLYDQTGHGPPTKTGDYRTPTYVVHPDAAVSALQGAKHGDYNAMVQRYRSAIQQGSPPAIARATAVQSALTARSSTPQATPGKLFSNGVPVYGGNVGEVGEKKYTPQERVQMAGFNPNEVLKASLTSSSIEPSPLRQPKRNPGDYQTQELLNSGYNGDPNWTPAQEIITIPEPSPVTGTGNVNVGATSGQGNTDVGFNTDTTGISGSGFANVGGEAQNVAPWEESTPNVVDNYGGIYDTQAFNPVVINDPGSMSSNPNVEKLLSGNDLAPYGIGFDPGSQNLDPYTGMQLTNPIPDWNDDPIIQNDGGNDISNFGIIPSLGDDLPESPNEMPSPGEVVDNPGDQEPPVSESSPGDIVDDPWSAWIPEENQSSSGEVVDDPFATQESPTDNPTPSQTQSPKNYAGTPTDITGGAPPPDALQQGITPGFGTGVFASVGGPFSSPGFAGPQFSSSGYSPSPYVVSGNPYSGVKTMGLGVGAALGGATGGFMPVGGGGYNRSYRSADSWLDAGSVGERQQVKAYRKGLGEDDSSLVVGFAKPSKPNASTNWLNSRPTYKAPSGTYGGPATIGSSVPRG